MAAVPATQSQSVPSDRAPEQHPDHKLAETLSQIREDAVLRSPSYGKESVVPEGGE